jgi:hypothetical protein
MRLKIAIESLVVGLAAQVAVGWISPFTPLLTGFVAGVVDGNEKEGMYVGFLVGIITVIGFVVRAHLSLNLPYIYPTETFLSNTGAWGQYLIIIVMLALGTIGGRVGGAVMQRSSELSYKRGQSFGEAKRMIEKSGKK